MNQKQVVRVVLLVVLGIGFAIVMYMQFFRESEEERKIRENFEKSQAQLKAGAASAPAAPAGTPGAPAAGAAATAPGAASIFKETVDIDELLVSIKTVDFKYNEERETRNPMTPLVGPFAPPELQAQETGEAPAQRDSLTAQLIMVARSMIVSGILWDAQQPMAVVDDEVVSAGHEFPNGIRVEAIEENQVTLRVKDTLIPLELKEQ